MVTAVVGHVEVEPCGRLECVSKAPVLEMPGEGAFVTLRAVMVQITKIVIFNTLKYIFCLL